MTYAASRPVTFFFLPSYGVVAMHEDVEAHLWMKYHKCTLWSHLYRISVVTSAPQVQPSVSYVHR